MILCKDTVAAFEISEDSMVKESLWTTTVAAVEFSEDPMVINCFLRNCIC